MAFVAILPEARTGAIIGVARVAVTPGERPGVAPAAAVVADAYQHRSLGTLLLLRLLAYAPTRTITTIFTAWSFLTRWTACHT